MHRFWSLIFFVISSGYQWMPLGYQSKHVKPSNPCISKSEKPTSMGISLYKMPTYDGKTQHAFMMGPIFSFFGGGERGVLFWVGGPFSLIPNMFPTCSQQVLEGIPNSTSILSHMVCRKFNLHVYKLKRLAIGENICLNFATGRPKRCFHWGGDQCSKFFVDGPMNMALSKTKKQKKKL